MIRQITWLCVFVEGVVIVGSILLTFGIEPISRIERNGTPVTCCGMALR